MTFNETEISSLNLILCLFSLSLSLTHSRHRAGIFAYLNYLTPKTRCEVLECLVTGLERLEYRGYDSAGVAVDTNDTKNILLIKSTGKVKVLEEAIAEQMKSRTRKSNISSRRMHRPSLNTQTASFTWR
jgi:glutamine phosphoribosylpyrophosphate amidotransferase